MKPECSAIKEKCFVSSLPLAYLLLKKHKQKTKEKKRKEKVTFL